MDRNRMKAALEAAGVTVDDAASDIELINRIRHELFVPGSSREKLKESPLTHSELRLLYDLDVRAIYRRHEEFRLHIARSGKAAAMPLVKKLTDDHEHLVAVSYDIERFRKDIKLIDPKEHPERVKWFEEKIAELEATREALLAAVPAAEKAVAEAL